MATLRNKRKLATVSRETPESTRSGRTQNILDPELTQDYISQVSEEIEGRVTKKLSKEFSRTESRILGALSKLDEFLLNIKEQQSRKPGNQWGSFLRRSWTWSGVLFPSLWVGNSSSNDDRSYRSSQYSFTLSWFFLAKYMVFWTKFKLFWWRGFFSKKCPSSDVTGTNRYFSKILKEARKKLDFPQKSRKKMFEVWQEF